MVSRNARRKSLQEKHAPVRIQPEESYFKAYEKGNEEKLLGDYVKVSVNVPKGKNHKRKHHVRKKKVVVKKCGENLVVGVDIKFSPLVNSLDGSEGVATIYRVSPNGPGARAGLKVGDRILSVFNIVAHTKKEFFGIFAQYRALKKTQNVPLFIEKPCKIAQAEAKRSAEMYIMKNMASPVLRTAGFKCRCTHCGDTARALCRDSPNYVDPVEIDETSSRRHSISVARNHNQQTRNQNIRVATLSIKSSSKLMVGKQKFSSSSIASKGAGKGSRSNMSWNSDSSSDVELQHVFSFSELVNRDRSRHNRRRTVS